MLNSQNRVYAMVYHALRYHRTLTFISGITHAQFSNSYKGHGLPCLVICPCQGYAAHRLLTFISGIKNAQFSKS